jgi:hypothetical protein
MKQMQFFLWAASVGVGIVVFVYSTFTTQAALEEKEKAILGYVDVRHDAVQTRLERIEVILERIDARLYELQRGAK